jgi:hypothetical protein
MSDFQNRVFSQISHLQQKAASCHRSAMRCLEVFDLEMAIHEQEVAAHCYAANLDWWEAVDAYRKDQHPRYPEGWVHLAVKATKAIG